jgi:hypothetical protein
MGKIKTTLDLLGKPIGALSEYMQEFDPKNWYHGTARNPDITKFDTSQSQEYSMPATYFTTSKPYAEGFSEQYGEGLGKVYNVKIKTKDLFDYRNPEHIEKIKSMVDESAFQDIKYGDPWILQRVDVGRKLEKLGFRGFYTNEIDPYGEAVGLFYPDKGDVRSVFAKFDPTKKESGNILAAVPVGALGLLAGGEDEQD